MVRVALDCQQNGFEQAIFGSIDALKVGVALEGGIHSTAIKGIAHGGLQFQIELMAKLSKVIYLAHGRRS